MMSYKTVILSLYKDIALYFAVGESIRRVKVRKKLWVEIKKI